MKRQLITYILAAFCATAILSCNKEAAHESIASDTECTVLLTASIDASTKAFSIDENKVVCTWAVGDSVMLARKGENKIIAKLKVISVNGDKAQLTGKVRGTYAKDTEMILYYGGNSYNYDYSGQTGTVESVVSRAYMMAETTIDAVDGKSLFLRDVAMVHQQSYIGLSFYHGDQPVKVKSIAITVGGDEIVKTHPLNDVETTYGSTEHFVVESEAALGQEVFYFALRDNSTAPDHKYELEITTITEKLPKNDTTVYKGKLAAPGLSGNYFADSKVILVRLSPVITAPTVYSYVYYDGNPHNLITPAVLQPGATAYYGVSTLPEVVPTEWNPSIPMRTEEGSYTVWYKVDGGRDYENILPTRVGTTLIKPMDATTIDLPSAITGLVYNAAEQTLVNNDGVVKVNGAPIVGAKLEYYVRFNDPTAPSSGSTGWSEDLPKGTNAGPYYIWCRYLGDGLYQPAMSTTYRQVTIAKKSATVQVQNLSCPVGATITSDSITVTPSGLLSGHVLYSKDLTIPDTSSAGDKIIMLNSVVIHDSSDNDVTGNYSIGVVNGTLTVY